MPKSRRSPLLRSRIVALGLGLLLLVVLGLSVWFASRQYTSLGIRDVQIPGSSIKIPLTNKSVTLPAHGAPEIPEIPATIVSFPKSNAIQVVTSTGSNKPPENVDSPTNVVLVPKSVSPAEIHPGLVASTNITPVEPHQEKPLSESNLYKIPLSWFTNVPPVTNILLAQIALSGYGISVGSIDGLGGNQTASALQAFQMDHGLEPTGRLDQETQHLLQLRHPPFTVKQASAEELAHLMPLPVSWLEKAAANRLEFSTWLELVGEAAHAQPAALTRWNPGFDWHAVKPGQSVSVPAVDYPPVRRAALVRISLTNHWLRAFSDRGGLIAHFPCSIGRIAEKRPVGDLHVTSVAKDPNYTFNPAVFPESPEAQATGRKLILPPGPNNPVGVAWIGLDRPGYGIHGTPLPEQVGRTESHGCFRLANWNADYLRQLVRVGTSVNIEP